MRLLVSVRSGGEVQPALSGGADIIDAKEPANGSLGAVSSATLHEIAARVSPLQELSVACGDVRSVAEVITVLEQLQLPQRTAPTYVKLGFAGVESQELLGSLLRTAVERATRHASPVSIVAVAYADAPRVPAFPAEIILRSAVRARAAGVLIDTCVKDGTRLLDWWTSASLTGWISMGRASGLLVGVAGALRPEDVPTVACCAPDVVGFRGAACEAGRSGQVSPQRVAMLRRCVDAACGSAHPVPDLR